MKQFLKYATIALAGVLPILGAEESSSIAEITDPFFVKLTSNSSGNVWISETREIKDGKIKMTIEGQDNTENRSIPIEPTCRVVGSENEDDDTKTYQQIVEASVKCGDQLFKDKLTRSQRVSYPSKVLETNMVSGSPVKDEDLPLGVVASMSMETVFTRPSDQKELRKRGAPAGEVVARGLHQGHEITTAQDFLALGVPSLKVYKTKLESTDTQTQDTDPVIYELILKTKVSPIAGAFYFCVDHNFPEISYKGMRKQTLQRCCLGTYEQFSENLQVLKRTLTGTETLVYSDPKIIKVKLFQTSRQQRNAANIPTDHCLQNQHQYLPPQLDNTKPPHEVVNVRPIVN